MPKHPRYIYPFTRQDYFYIPRSWLQTVTLSSMLDVGTALFSMLEDSGGDSAYDQAISGHITSRLQRHHIVSDLDFWSKMEVIANVPALCSDETYSSQRDLLLAQNIFRKCTRESARRIESAKLNRRQSATVNQIAQSTLYEFVNWPPEPRNLLYCPRFYIDYRWPGWFGQNSAGIRAAAFAFFDHNTHQAQLSTFISEDELIARAFALLPNFKGLNAEDILNGLLRLQALGLVDFDGRRYTMPVKRLQRAPNCRTEILERLLNNPNSFRSNSGFLEVLGVLIQDWHVPISRIAKVADDLESACLNYTCYRTPEDFLLLKRHITKRRSGLLKAMEADASNKPYIPTPEKLAHDFGNHLAKKQRQGVSPTYHFKLKSDSRATAVHAAARGARRFLTTPERTELLIRFSWKRRVQPEQVCALIQSAWLLIDQLIPDEVPHNHRRMAIPLGPCLPDRREIESIYKLDALNLHQRLDFAHPFEMVLFTQHQEENIELECHLRYFYPPQSTSPTQRTP